MDRLIAQDAALRQCYAFHKAQDSLDKTLFLSLFEPKRKATLDMSKHIPNMQALELTPDEFWNAVALGMSGFTATHHQLGNPMFECDRALENITVSALVTAYHCIDQDGVLESVTARVMQTIDLQLWDGKWMISRVSVARGVPMDNPDLYTKAQERAKNGRGRVDAQAL